MRAKQGKNKINDKFLIQSNCATELPNYKYKIIENRRKSFPKYRVK